MKSIKFDLPLNGTKIATVEQLKDNLTPEILESFRSGKLTKWLRVRNLIEQTNQIDSLLAEDAKHEMELVKSLYGLFDKKVNDDVLQTALTDYKKLSPSSNNANDDEIEQLKAELAKKELEIEQLKNPPKPKIIETRIGKFIARDDGTAIDTETGLMWCRYSIGQRWENSNISGLCGVSGDGKRISWDTVTEHICSFNQFVSYGFTDWRLPTIDELKSIVELNTTPSINVNIFPNTPTTSFWTSTPSSRGKIYAMLISFKFGDVIDFNNDTRHAARLVRG